MFMSYKKFNMKKIRLYLLFSLLFIFPVSVAVSSASKPVVRQSEPVISETIEGIGAVVAVSPDDLRNRFLSGRRGMPFPMDLTTLPEPAGKLPPGSRIPHSDVFSTLPAVPVQRDESGDQFYSDEIAGAWQAFFDNNGYDVQTGFGGDLEKDLKNNQKNNLLNTSSYMVIYDEKP